MANLADIPPELLNNWRAYEFLLWLNALPISKPDKLELAKLWSEKVNRPLSGIEWATIL
jgi:hypothetical protein